MCITGSVYSFVGMMSPDLTANWGLLSLIYEDGKYMTTIGELLPKLLLLLIPFLAIYAIYAWFKTKSIIHAVLLTASAFIFAMFISILGMMAIGIIIILAGAAFAIFMPPTKYFVRYSDGSTGIEES
jgi:hypothetical protein